MSCCAPGAEAGVEIGAPEGRDEVLLASHVLEHGIRQTDLSVPSVHCASCIRAIEDGLRGLPDVVQARVNLSTRRVAIKWRGDEPPPMIETLTALGYPANLFDTGAEATDPEQSRLVRALAVAGFCAMNIMLLSVSVWSGADADTRNAFHWISALLALSALLYSGPVFFRSAWAALRKGRTNMDVPISIGILLAFALSLYDTIRNGEHAYFDAATSLIFFLLIGRVLDHMMREKARAAVRGLMRLAPRGATVLRADGSLDYLPVGEIRPGMRIRLTAGDRVPVDGLVEEGASELDCAIATGESSPQRVAVGSPVIAGTLNLSGPLTIVAGASAQASFLAEMVRLIEAAEGGRARYRRLADRAARLYSPIVHATAFLTFLGWMMGTGDWHRSIGVAIAVLIITCPCALGLAVPIVQVVAARRLFENGIMVKDGSGIERLAEIDMVVFDKTGTLTSGVPRLLDVSLIAPAALATAAAMAGHSCHPLSKALRAACAGRRLPAIALSNVTEFPGLGIEARLDGTIFRLGRADWALSADDTGSPLGTVLSREGRLVVDFAFEDQERAGAAEAVVALKSEGLKLEILSGDREPTVAAMAQRLGIADHIAGVLPAGKIDRLNNLAKDGHAVLMVGDGLNDAPALAAAHVSMAPANAADIGRNAADFVFLHENLGSVPTAIEVAREAGRLVRQNFVLAIAYNAIALPIAIAGHVTPLIAALAMSLSSIVVVANALRLKAGRPEKPATAVVAARPISSLAAAE